MQGQEQEEPRQSSSSSTKAREVNENDRNITIHFRILSHHAAAAGGSERSRVSLTVPASTSIRELKIELARGFPHLSSIEHQRLLFRGRVLRDHQTLEENQIAQDHTIHVVVAPIAAATTSDTGIPARSTNHDQENHVDQNHQPTRRLHHGSSSSTTQGTGSTATGDSTTMANMNAFHTLTPPTGGGPSSLNSSSSTTGGRNSRGLIPALVQVSTSLRSGSSFLQEMLLEGWRREQQYEYDHDSSSFISIQQSLVSSASAFHQLGILCAWMGNLLLRVDMYDIHGEVLVAPLHESSTLIEPMSLYDGGTIVQFHHPSQVTSHRSTTDEETTSEAVDVAAHTSNHQGIRRQNDDISFNRFSSNGTIAAGSHYRTRQSCEIHETLSRLEVPSMGNHHHRAPHETDSSSEMFLFSIQSLFRATQGIHVHLDHIIELLQNERRIVQISDRNATQRYIHQVSPSLMQIGTLCRRFSEEILLDTNETHSTERRTSENVSANRTRPGEIYRSAADERRETTTSTNATNVQHFIRDFMMNNDGSNIGLSAINIEANGEQDAASVVHSIFQQIQQMTGVTMTNATSSTINNSPRSLSTNGQAIRDYPSDWSVRFESDVIHKLIDLFQDQTQPSNHTAATFLSFLHQFERSQIEAWAKYTIQILNSRLVDTELQNHMSSRKPVFCCTLLQPLLVNFVTARQDTMTVEDCRHGIQMFWEQIFFPQWKQYLEENVMGGRRLIHEMVHKIFKKICQLFIDPYAASTLAPTHRSSEYFMNFLSRSFQGVSII